MFFFFLLQHFYFSYISNNKRYLLIELQSFLSFFGINQNRRIIFAGDFRIYFSSKLEAGGGKPILKKKIMIKLVHIRESLDICDIWRIRNPKRQNFTFRQRHPTAFIERRLDYIFVSNCHQERVNYTDVLPAISTDHSPVLISLSNSNSNNNGCGLWKHNSSLVYDEFYVENMKKTNYKN